jgi:hypothetical protein
MEGQESTPSLKLQSIDQIGAALQLLGAKSDLLKRA